jgi:type I restriction enzyme, S subunit
MRSRCDPDRFDLLISCSGSIGRVTIVDKDNEYVMVRSAALVKTIFGGQISPYLEKALISDCLQQQMGSRSKAAAQPNLFIGAIRQLIVPLPPLAEQHRIVAKVDELMALCDRLEASLDAAATTRRRLLDALLAATLAPAAEPAMEAAE